MMWIKTIIRRAYLYKHMINHVMWNVDLSHVSTWVSFSTTTWCSLICHHWIEICPTNLPPFSLHTCIHTYINTLKSIYEKVQPPTFLYILLLNIIKRKLNTDFIGLTFEKQRWTDNFHQPQGKNIHSL